MAPDIQHKSSAGWKGIVNGAVLQCAEAATLGMPFEVWKTRMGRFRNETTAEAFVNIYKRGGPLAFWQGLSAKLVEAASKGGVLLYSKESILSSTRSMGMSETASGFIAGAGAGVCQTVVMGPCTFLVTCVVTSENKNVSLVSKSSDVWKRQGIKGFYPGGTAIAFRQATNWASRQGLTDWTRTLLKKRGGRGEDGKLSMTQEAIAGTVGGALSTWNQPFEVARIYMQAAANEGRPRENIVQVFRYVQKTDGTLALFKGIIPRMGLSIWQTLFMVSAARVITERFLT